MMVVEMFSNCSRTASSSSCDYQSMRSERMMICLGLALRHQNMEKLQFIDINYRAE